MNVIANCKSEDCPEKWDALEALASLNEACKVLHTGADGVSKTWEDVAITGSVLLEQE